MIGKLIKMLAAGLAYFALGTLLAEGVAVYLLWSQGGLAPDRLTQALAALQGVKLPEPETAEQPVAPPQPSLEDIAWARAIKLRQIEQRETALAAVREMAREDRQAITAEKTELNNQRQAYTAELATLHDTAIEQGREHARQLLEGLDPDKAKAQVLKMLDNDQLDEVVMMFQQMSTAKRNDIANEFENEEEKEKLAEILRRTHQGVPDAETAARAMRAAAEDAAAVDGDDNAAGEPAAP
ncbi:MAG: hypothetical protein K1X74_22860 [Pirellulales bacterium]|nr:hypothetical protein [Pirellulales bacterium]